MSNSWRYNSGLRSSFWTRNMWDNCGFYCSSQHTEQAGTSSRTGLFFWSVILMINDSWLLSLISIIRQPNTSVFSQQWTVRLSPDSLTSPQTPARVNHVQWHPTCWHKLLSPEQHFAAVIITTATRGRLIRNINVGRNKLLSQSTSKVIFSEDRWKNIVEDLQQNTN